MPPFPARLVMTAAIALLMLSLNMTVSAAGSDGVRHVTPAEAEKLIEQKPEIIVLDIRTPEEFRHGHIESAVNIDYYATDFGKLLAGLDPNASYLLHCKSGNRSTRSLPVMKAAGLHNITHLDGGFDGWRAAGLKIVTD